MTAGAAAGALGGGEAALGDPVRRGGVAAPDRLLRGGEVLARRALGLPAALEVLGEQERVGLAARPGSRPSPGLALRLAAVAGVPVEVLLGGKVVVAPIVIGVAA